MTNKARNLYFLETLAEELSDTYRVEAIRRIVPQDLGLHPTRVVITDAYYGKEKGHLLRTRTELGLQLTVKHLIDGSPREDEVAYHQPRLIDRFIDDIELGTRRHDRGIMDVAKLAGTELVGYTKSSGSGAVTLVALSAIPK